MELSQERTDDEADWEKVTSEIEARLDAQDEKLGWDWLEAESKRWADEHVQCIDESYNLALQVVKEIEARDTAKPKRGRPAYLPSYAEYKRKIVSNWVGYIDVRSGLTQVELAKELGFVARTEKADKSPAGDRMLRFVKSGTKGKSGGQNRMPRERVIEIEKAIRKHEWHLDHRNGVALIYPAAPLLSPERFEQLAISIASMTLEKYREQNFCSKIAPLR